MNHSKILISFLMKWINNYSMKKILLSAFLFIVTSCASNQQPQQLNSLPSWYISPKAFDNQNLYGAGEGYTLAEASKSALNNLSGKLMTSISSESSILLESNKYSTNEQSRQKISEVVAKITFNNYQVSNSAAFNNKIYAEVSVDRSNFITDYSQKLSDLNNKMADKFSKAQNKSILEKLNDYEDVSNLSFEASSVALILASLTQDNNFKNKIDLYSSYQSSYQELASKIEFYIENKDASRTLVSKVISDLNKKKYKVVKSKNLNNPNLVIIHIDMEKTEQKIYGSYMARIKLDFNLLSNQNKVIKSASFESKGSSVISASEALNAAILGIEDFHLF